MPCNHHMQIPSNFILDSVFRKCIPMGQWSMNMGAWGPTSIHPAASLPPHSELSAAYFPGSRHCWVQALPWVQALLGPGTAGSLHLRHKGIGGLGRVLCLLFQGTLSTLVLGVSPCQRSAMLKVKDTMPGQGGCQRRSAFAQRRFVHFALCPTNYVVGLSVSHIWTHLYTIVHRPQVRER